MIALSKMPLCVFLLTLCNCSDIFHERSKIVFIPSRPAIFFGYSVAITKSRLIVGAPKAEITGRQSTAATGAVFNCPTSFISTSVPIICTPLDLGLRSTNQIKNYMRDDAWFGATLAVGPSGKIVICAPRWARPLQTSQRLVATSNGACYMITKRHNSFIFPLGSIKQGFYSNITKPEYSEYNRGGASTILDLYTFAQAGMALKVAENNILIGAPGLLQWAGGIIQYTYDPNVNSIAYNHKPIYNPFFTHDLGPDEYFGYSVESGIFEDSGTILYVTGGPKGKGGFGVVLVFEPPTIDVEPLNIAEKLVGPQFGAYFGASICALDINGDGRTDLLVGAPNYVKWFDREVLYDQGAVYVYLNKEQVKGFILEYAGQVTGSEANGAKFGYGIADLGDIDGDGFSDVVISAPWEDHGAGAVYIYRGGLHGLRGQYVQRIVASGAWGFGIGLTRGHDVDGNKCNDIVIGAHVSSTVYIYKCIPTVKAEAFIKIPGQLSLPQNTTNFTTQFCVKLSSLREHSTKIILELKATVTVDREGNRATIAGNSTYSYKVSAGVPSDHCQNQTIDLKPGSDLSKPISIVLDIEPINRMQDNSTEFITDAGRVSTESVMHHELDIQLASDCGEDLICTPWLELNLEPMSEPYIPGSEDKLGVIITVVNTEEPAFGIRVNLTLPSPPKRVPGTCNLQGLNMTCDLPSPLIRNDEIKWEVEFEYTHEMRDMGVTMINAGIDDTVVNRKVSDNATQYMEMNITPIANISANGYAVPNATVHVPRDKLSEGSSINFVHYFQITNAGPSDWPDLGGSIEVFGKVTIMSKTVAGCFINGTVTMECFWSLKARESLSVAIPLRYDLAIHGKALEADLTSNITSTLFVNQKNLFVLITTKLVLDPVPPYRTAIIVGAVVGLLLLAIILYSLYKCGFFSRKGFMKLENNAIDEEPGCSKSLLPASNASIEDISKAGCLPESMPPNGSDEDLSKPSCSSESTGPNDSDEDVLGCFSTRNPDSTPASTATVGSTDGQEIGTAMESI